MTTKGKNNTKKTKSKTGGKLKLFQPKKELEVPNQLRKIKIKMTNGEFLETKSTLANETLSLSKDRFNHDAWVGRKKTSRSRGSKFSENFKDINFTD